MVEDELVIGRQAEGDGALASDVEISRQHARISAETEGRFGIEDLGSTNGTYVNGRRLDGRVTLETGDRITLGASALVVQLSSLQPTPTTSDTIAPAPGTGPPAAEETTPPWAERRSAAPADRGGAAPALRGTSLHRGGAAPALGAEPARDGRGTASGARRRSGRAGGGPGILRPADRGRRRRRTGHRLTRRHLGRGAARIRGRALEARLRLRAQPPAAARSCSATSPADC